MASDWQSEAKSALDPPPVLTLSEWADEHFYLSAESAASPGRWKTLPYQKAIMDAITDPAVTNVSFMKSARVGATKMMNATIGYYMDHDPCPIMVVQPTIEDAKGYSKEEIAPMIRDCKRLAAIVDEPKEKTSSQTILHKTFPGGSLSMVGANSGRGFRRVSRRVVLFDEVDGYPASAGSEGDPIKLGTRRAEYYWNRKIVAASTPLTSGASRIEELFDAGDKRRYHVPCPSCGHADILVFRQGADKVGHYMQWVDDDPSGAFFVCSLNGCAIEHDQKFAMLEAGEWRAENEFSGHASFHIWAAYSMSPNASWGQIAAEFVEVSKQGVEKLKTFVNTILGETWKEKGDAPPWEKLYHRRENYPICSVPDGVILLTAGVDVQKDRFVYEVVGWTERKESYSIDCGLLFGDPSNEESWAQLDELLNRNFEGRTISMMAVDAAWNTQQVYNWCRRYPMTRVIAVRGVSTAKSLISSPSAVEITVRGKKMPRGYKLWPVGVNIAKSELYGWLGLQKPEEGEDFPSGYCHFPEYEEEYFKQLTGEEIVTVRKKGGFSSLEWRIVAGRQNHWLDTRVYARAAAAVMGIDKMQPRRSSKSGITPAKPKKNRTKKKAKNDWLHGKKKGWIR